MNELNRSAHNCSSVWGKGSVRLWTGRKIDITRPQSQWVKILVRNCFAFMRRWEGSVVDRASHELFLALTWAI
jgi:hypothetical protein